MPFYIFAWTASIVYAIYSITAKLIGTHRLKNVSQFSFFITLFSGFVTAIISLLNGAKLPGEWLYIVLAGLFLSLGNILYLSALKQLDVSVMSPLFNLRVVITVFFGYLFLNESLSINSTLLIGLIVLAGVFATMDERFSIKSFFTKNIALGLFFMMVLSIQTIFVNKAIEQTDYWTASLWMGLIAPLFSFIFLYSKFYKDVIKSKISDYFEVAILAIIGGIGDLSAYKAFEGNVGISSVIISLPISMLMAFGLAIWKPNLLEKHHTAVYLIRLLAASVMIWGALNLSKL